MIIVYMTLALFTVIALYDSSSQEPQTLPHHSALLLITTNPFEAIRVARGVESHLFFTRGGHVTIYRGALEDNMCNYKLHRQGDDQLMCSSPIVYIRRKCVEENDWEEEWYGRELASMVIPALGITGKQLYVDTTL